jgi:RNA polymerase-interacting CarD/CdnL/TRCF family regulator
MTAKKSAPARSRSTAKKAAIARKSPVKKAVAAKKAVGKKPPTKKAPTKRAAARKVPAKKAAARKALATKAAAKKAAAKKAAAKKAAAKKAAAKKAAAKKALAKKALAKKALAKKALAKKALAKKAAAKKVAAKKAPARKPVPAKKVAPPPPPPPPPKPKPIPFKKGDKVVYPHHGAATIIATEKREFDGKRQDFFVLQVAIDQLILRVPASRSVDLGVRPVISKTAAKRVLAVFRTDPEEAGANWSRWYKLLTEKINSGDIFQVAEVVRDLTFAQQTKGISPALKRMLSKARMILASELRFALNLSEEDAMKRLDKSLPRVDADEEE